MSHIPTHRPAGPAAICDFLADPLRVGDPDIAGPLAVYPIFAPEPRLRYLAFAQARGEGFRAGELAGVKNIAKMVKSCCAVD